jgi:hypothetical protein
VSVLVPYHPYIYRESTLIISFGKINYIDHQLVPLEVQKSMKINKLEILLPPLLKSGSYVANIGIYMSNPKSEWKIQRQYKAKVA